MSTPSDHVSAGERGRATLVLIDDHPIVRVGSRTMLEAAGFTVLLEAGDDADARLAALPRPDVFLVGLNPPRLRGLSVIERLAAVDPTRRILASGALDDDTVAERALAAGAAGYFSKRTAEEEFVTAVHAVAVGRNYLDPDTAGRLARRRFAEVGGSLEQLTARELQVMSLLARGSSLREIALQTGLSYKTVAQYSGSLKAKLGASTIAGVLQHAARRGLVEPEPGAH